MQTLPLVLPTVLPVVQQLTTRLDQAEIHYCHWKSNEHVDAAVQGKTDLDVLVDRRAKNALKLILCEVGFKPFVAIPCRRYRDIEDYLAIDPTTGVLVHLHLHYELELGEKNLKGYHLPWSEQLLSSRLYCAESAIHTAEPNLEMILLIVRAVLKVRWRDRLKAWLGQDYFKGDFIREFRWLQQRIDRAQVQDLSQKLLGHASATLIDAILEDQSNLGHLLSAGNPIQVVLRPYRHYAPAMALTQRWWREWQNLLYRVLRQRFNLPIATRRTAIEGGIVIAFLGADGSGKSTVTAEVVRCLSQKLDVFPVYLGSGQGSASLFRLPLIAAANLKKGLKKGLKGLQSPWRSSTLSMLLPGLARFDQTPPILLVESDGLSQSGIAQAPVSQSSVSQSSVSQSPASQFARLLWALTLVYEKQRKLKQVDQAKKRGMIVIADRYPQSQILGFNDGPLLSHGFNQEAKKLPWLPGFLQCFLQQWEIARYREMAEKTPPDVVIKLNVTPDVALARKPESPADGVCRKVAAVQSLTFPPQTVVVNIDATQPLQQVILQVKQAVWENL